jgi:ABC-2 type transport system ATP-binding protein
MTSIIEVNNLTVRYGRKNAVDGVTLAVPQGSVYALLGRNGAGKSSLVRCLLGQQKAKSGAVRLFGDDSWTHRTMLMERIGVVSEDADAPPEMSVGALSRFCSRLYSRWQQSSVDARLDRFGISQKARFGSLSKGQKKQVSLALALAMSPDLIVLDDPTLGLDVVARKSFFEEVIGELADRGITILLTTHDLAGVETIADRVGIMKDGRLALDEEMETLKARFRRVRFAGVIPSSAEREESAATVRDGSLAALGMTARAVRQWGSGAEAVVTNYDDIAFERFRATTSGAEVSPMSLEEIFIAVAGENAGAES